MGWKIDYNLLSKIESILARGERVEIVPVKDGVRVYEIKRREARPS